MNSGKTTQKVISSGEGPEGLNEGNNTEKGINKDTGKGELGELMYSFSMLYNKLTQTQSLKATYMYDLSLYGP